jgi:hypothetical protein
LLLVTGVAHAAPARQSAGFTAMQACLQIRDQQTFDPRDPANVVISNENKEPMRWLALRHDDVILVVAQTGTTIDTSPGQIFLPNGAWGADGNGRAAPDDWLIAGASQFAVSVEGLGRSEIVGRKSACLLWRGGTATIPVNTGLNVVQSGPGSPLANRWEGSIGVRIIQFTISSRR